MKILQARFKNLNSLPGEWSVDFTHPAYTADGIFAITGPTGAGKTTILDAICLALYGMTPRLGRITAASNEMMSRHTGECFAEVTFETSKKRYRCHWSQHRARRSPSGAFQGQKHEISDADTEKVLESKVSHVVSEVHKKTGMTFDQFTRSMLLAQGAFAAFLQAGGDERAPILEQITRTEIYSRISIKAHERSVQENQALSDLKARLDGLRLLTEEEIHELKDELKEKQAAAAKMAESLDQHRKMIAWLDTIAALEKEISELQTALSTLETERSEFEPKAERLEKANRAIRIKGDYMALNGLRKTQSEELKSLREYNKKAPELETRLNKMIEARGLAVKRLENARSELKSEMETLKRVRELDFKCAETHVQIQKAEKANETADKKRKARRSDIAGKEKRLKKHQASLEEIGAYLRNQAGDAGLRSEYGMIRKTVEDYRKNEEKHRKIGSDLSNAADSRKKAAGKAAASEKDKLKAAEELAEAEKADKAVDEQIEIRLDDRSMTDWRNDMEALKEHKNALTQGIGVSERISGNQNTIRESEARRKQLVLKDASLEQEANRINRDIQDCEKETGHLEREKALLDRIRDLDEARKRLEDGHPCPLCGSTAHPYAEGNVPEMDATQNALKQSKDRLKTLSGRASAIAADRSRISAEIAHIDRDIQERNQAVSADQASLLHLLKEIDPDADMTGVRDRLKSELDSLEARIAAVRETINDIEKLEKQKKKTAAGLTKARESSARAERTFEQAGYALKSAEQEQLRLEKALAESESGLNVLYDDIRAKLSSYGFIEFQAGELKKILETLDQRGKLWDEHQERKIQEERSIASLKAELENRRDELKDLDEVCAAAEQAHLELKRQYDGLTQNREAVYGTKDPDEEERRVNQQVADAEKALETIRIQVEKTEREADQVKSAINHITESTDRRRRDLEQAENEFITLLENTGFPDETAYLDALISEKEQNELKAESDRLSKQKAELETRLKDKTGGVQKEREKQMTDRPKTVLLEDMREKETALERIQQDMGGVQQRLKEDQEARERRKEHVREIELKRKECVRWDQLKDLIGAHDGKKFRNFAQSLTLEMMAAFANRQLSKMTDRYCLIRNDEKPLELNVVDHYQAGEIRSTKNLSGGESFIVSMALALGLSRLSSRNARVDSLFLDEGFGTLDEDALETALETLAGLRQDGKLIGVISHVASIKDRIATQIQVIPRSGGRSVLSGPGVRRISN